ncbi:hypothetical protein BZL39_A09010 [Zygosaccharomyces parabailii]|nr:hypothetical protein BZL39_A09010 [Zygosaccharomyces parabailii]
MNNNTEVQYILLQTGGEPDDLILPRDKFDSRFRYGIITRKCLVFYILSCILVICACSIWIIIAGTQFVPMIILTICPFAMVMVGLIIDQEGRNNWINNVRIKTQNSLSLLREVVKVKSGLDARKWDTIAARLNKFFMLTTVPPPHTSSTTGPNAPSSSRIGTLDHRYADVNLVLPVVVYCNP